MKNPNPTASIITEIIAAHGTGAVKVIDYTTKSGRIVKREATVRDIVPGGVILTQVTGETRRFNWGGILDVN